jgi:hypothetical protein
LYIYKTALLNPLKLQDICRYRIRQQIREAIEKENADYYKIKREMSTFNERKMQSLSKRGQSEGYDNDYDNDDDAEDSSNEPSGSEFPLTRYERFFAHRNRASADGSYYENQLRLMIYG